MMLKQKIITEIADKGPMTIERYMGLCLNDKEEGYYKKQQAFGTKGDFITAPEISQMFGEILAIWMIQIWQKQSIQTNFTLCEIGPGQGTLMFDILYTIKKLAPDYLKKSEIILIETSPRLTKIQKEKLSSYDLPICWQTSFHKIKDQPLFLIANELLDALPIRQFILKKQKLFERKVQYDSQKEKFFFIEDTKQTHTSYNTAFSLIEQNYCGIIEDSPQRDNLIKDISQFIAKNGGAALFVDYGSLTPAFGDTLQAVLQHNYHPVLEDPGLCDLTAHVDFYSLAKTATECQCAAFGMTQGDFLLKLGLLERAQNLGYKKNPHIQQQIINAVHRLAAPDEMGQLFKVLMLCQKQDTYLPFTEKERYIFTE